MTIKQITIISKHKKKKNTEKRKQKNKKKHGNKKAKKPKNTYGLKLNIIPNMNLMFK